MFDREFKAILGSLFFLFFVSPTLAYVGYQVQKDYNNSFSINEAVEGFVSAVFCRSGFKNHRIDLDVSGNSYHTTSRLLEYENECDELENLLESANLEVTLLALNEPDIMIGKELIGLRAGETLIFSKEDWQQYQKKQFIGLYLFSIFTFIVGLIGTIKFIRRKSM